MNRQIRDIIKFGPIFDSFFFSFSRTSCIMPPPAGGRVIVSSLEERKTLSCMGRYSLSIPKLGIKDAAIIIGSQDLSKSLIQWGGTAAPGEFGNTVIFGHSVLPAFFDPKNYMTIFSTLPTLKDRDEIIVYFDGITYRYQIFEMKVVDPKDLSVLEQRFDDSYISLVTCVPPGTYWKRLIVKAKLVKL